MQVLNPLSKHRLELNRRIREHVLGAAQSLHCVVVDVQTKAMEAQENTDPVEVRDDRVAVANHRGRAGC